MKGKEDESRKKKMNLAVSLVGKIQAVGLYLAQAIARVLLV